MKLTKTMKLVLASMASGRSAYRGGANVGARTLCLYAMQARGLVDLSRGEWVLTSKGRKAAK